MDRGKTTIAPHVVRDIFDVVGRRQPDAERPGKCAFAAMLQLVQEVVVVPPLVALAVRPGVGETFEFITLDANDLRIERLERFPVPGLQGAPHR